MIYLKEPSKPRSAVSLIAGHWWDSLALCKAQEAHGTVFSLTFWWRSRTLPPLQGTQANRTLQSRGAPWQILFDLDHLQSVDSNSGAIGFYQAGRNEWFWFASKSALYKNSIYNRCRAHRGLLGALPHPRALPGPAQPAAPASAGSGFRGNSGELVLPSDTLLP